MVVPGEPVLWGFGDLPSVLGDGSKILERIDAVESTGVNETHEHIPDQSTAFGLEKQRVLPMPGGRFQSTLTNVMPTSGLCRVAAPASGFADSFAVFAVADAA